MESLAKGAPWKPPTTQAIPKDIGLSWQTDSEALLLKTALTYLIEHREVKLVPSQSLHHPTSVQCTAWHPACYQRRKVTSAVANPVVYKGDLPVRYDGPIVGTANCQLLGTKAHSTDGILHDTARVQEAEPEHDRGLGETDYYCSAKAT